MKNRSVPTMLKRPLAWDIVLTVCAGLIAYTVMIAYYPGRANVDILYQARQALGISRYSDWHPPIISYIWEFLFRWTGQIGSLLVLQIALISAGSLLLALYLHRTSHNRWLSLTPLSLPIVPWSLGQLGILWKDSFMAGALLLGVALIMCVKPSRRWSIWLLIPAYLVLVFAIGTRKNAIFAVLPISVYASWAALRFLPKRKALHLPRQRKPWLRLAAGSAIALVLLGGGATGVDSWIAHARDVQKTSQISQIFLDDVMFSVPEAELNATDAPEELKQKINSARDKCIEMNEIWDAYWNCYGRGENGPFSAIAYQDELKQVWLETVPTHPVRYLRYRLAVFSYYFFSSKLEYWDFDWGYADGPRNGGQADVGLGSTSRTAEYIMRPYVVDFAATTFPVLFKPWFWFAVAITCLVLLRRITHYRAEIAVLSASALCYILGYIPIAPANHFRYTYWPALAATAAVFLVITAFYRRKHPPASGGHHDSSA